MNRPALIPRADGTYVLEHKGAPVDFPSPPGVYGFAPDTAPSMLDATQQSTTWSLKAQLPGGKPALVTLETRAGGGLALLVEPEHDGAWISWDIEGPGQAPHDIDRSALPLVVEGAPVDTVDAERLARETVAVSFELSAANAMALAQFVKRVGWSEMRACAVDDIETYEIRAGIDQLRRALAQAGYAPR